jgi:Tripartite tricarboxylate transporter family receptor
VPYRGTAQSTLELAEGRVEMQLGTIPPTLPHIRAGKLRSPEALGVRIRDDMKKWRDVIASAGIREN